MLKGINPDECEICQILEQGKAITDSEKEIIKKIQIDTIRNQKYKVYTSSYVATIDDIYRAQEIDKINKQRTSYADIEGLIYKKYDNLRYKIYNAFIDNKLQERIENPINPKILYQNYGYWEYHQIKDGKYSKAQYRISINAKGKPEVIEALDDFMAKYGNCRYKTPTDGNWNKRVDTVTMYFYEKPSEEQIRELSQKFTEINGIRNKEDFLPGQQIIPGMTFLKEPDDEDVKKLIIQGYLINDDIGLGIKRALTEPSAGVVYAVQEFLDEFKRAMGK